MSGKQSELLKQIQTQMQKYAEEEQFEKAAKMRDSYLDLQKTLERQKVVYENTKLNEDVIAVLYEDGILAIVIMMIREGRLIDKKDFTYFVDNIDKMHLCLKNSLLLIGAHAHLSCTGNGGKDVRAAWFISIKYFEKCLLCHNYLKFSLSCL